MKLNYFNVFLLNVLVVNLKADVNVWLQLTLFDSLPG